MNGTQRRQVMEHEHRLQEWHLFSIINQCARRKDSWKEKTTRLKGNLLITEQDVAWRTWSSLRNRHVYAWCECTLGRYESAPSRARLRKRQHRRKRRSADGHPPDHATLCQHKRFVPVASHTCTRGKRRFFLKSLVRIRSLDSKTKPLVFESSRLDHWNRPVMA